MEHRISSPRPWGCFRIITSPFCRDRLFPTPGGVFPFAAKAGSVAIALPHARGGVSKEMLASFGLDASSPRPWGCFPHTSRGCDDRLLFPTPVGVFLACSGNCSACPSLPHARGGVSDLYSHDVSAAQSSPRPWGCFRVYWGVRLFGGVFPTPVGVFLVRNEHDLRISSLPHARGGVSC